MIDLLLDHLLDALGHAQLNLLDPGRQLPMLCVVHQQVFRDEVIDHVDHEQRVALCSFMYQLREFIGKPVMRKPDRQVLLDRLLVEIPERQLFTLLFRQQLLLDCFKRMPARDQLRGSIRPDHHQLRRRALRCEIRDQVESRTIAPVKIFEYEHQRLPGSELVQRVAHFTQHAFTRCSQHFATQPLAIRGAQQRRHLQQPHRRMRA